MSKAELLKAAITKLQEAAHLLTEAGQERLALEANELTEWVGFSIPVEEAKRD
jgi:outer membrane biogenesis lipoprotein LolB